VVGLLVVIYTASGGTKAVSRTQVHQLLIALGGMAVALIIAIHSLPQDVTLVEAFRVAGRMGRLNAIDFHFDPKTQYNFWSGLIGGAFLALSYFGTDQSQVQRYLTGSSIAESRLGLLINGMVKVPMQFFILFVGAMVFVFYQFVAPPLFFNTVQRAKVSTSQYAAEYEKLEAQHQTQFTEKRADVQRLLTAMRAHDDDATAVATTALREVQQRETATRTAAASLINRTQPGADNRDTNYIFLTFVIDYLPAGVVGLVLAAIFCAAMSATSSGLNSLASTTVVDIFRRLGKPHATDAECVRLSKLSTIANRLGSLIEAVNKLGSLFYGTILAIFLLAFYTKRVSGTAAFLGALIGEAAVVWCALATDLAWLWWNVVGCVVGVVAALIVQRFVPEQGVGSRVSGVGSGIE
jgi:SSS family solute:Na+ symporter